MALPHFLSAADWDDAESMLNFRPLVPGFTAGLKLQGLRIHVRDHRERDLPIADRTLEAHYGRFSISQSRKTESEARRLALDVPYGRHGYDARVGHRPARMYELGPIPPPDDVDGRSPSVLTWHDGELFLLIASGEMAVQELMEIAVSFY